MALQSLLSLFPTLHPHTGIIRFLLKEELECGPQTLLYPVPSGTHMVGVYQRLTKWLALKGDLSSRDGAGGLFPAQKVCGPFLGILK